MDRTGAQQQQRIVGRGRSCACGTRVHYRDWRVSARHASGAHTADRRTLLKGNKLPAFSQDCSRQKRRWKAMMVATWKDDDLQTLRALLDFWRGFQCETRPLLNPLRTPCIVSCRRRDAAKKSSSDQSHHPTPNRPV